MAYIKQLLGGFSHMFYPQVCLGCGSDVIAGGNFICLHCTTNLPHTGFAMHAGNPVEKIFWGRIPLVAATSEFYFLRETPVQKLVHEFKYQGNREVGVFLGEMIGGSLLQSNRFQDIEALIPLPLNAGKLQKRGFNQAFILCKGIANILKVPVLDKNVIRNRFTQTQTKKHREERWQNVEGSFEIIDVPALQNKHLLLVDDVLTTGATLEACGSQLLALQNVRLSIATLAYAYK